MGPGGFTWPTAASTLVFPPLLNFQQVERYDPGIVFMVKTTGKVGPESSPGVTQSSVTSCQLGVIGLKSPKTNLGKVSATGSQIWLIFVQRAEKCVSQVVE